MSSVFSPLLGGLSFEQLTWLQRGLQSQKDQNQRPILELIQPTAVNFMLGDDHVDTTILKGISTHEEDS